MQKLLCSLPLSENQENALRAACPNTDIVIKPGHWTQEDVLDADFLLGYPDPTLLDGAKKLKLLQLTASGSEIYTGHGSSYCVTSATGAYGSVVSEYMLAALLSFYHRLHIYRNQQMQHLWQPAGVSTGISGKTVLILGTGDIGCQFAQKVKALGGHTVGLVRSSCRHPEFFDRLLPLDALDTILPQADVAALCIPGTAENRRLFSYPRLRTMASHAVLINVGRGTLVDTDGLYRCLKEQTLAGAILDVTDPEPLPADHPLWDMPNVILTPHCAGSFRNMPAELIQGIVDIACDNFRRYHAGLPLRNLR